MASAGESGYETSSLAAVLGAGTRGWPVLSILRARRAAGGMARPSANFRKVETPLGSRV